MCVFMHACIYVNTDEWMYLYIVYIYIYIHIDIHMFK
jgi:hypothetical protein